jgi:hypothetical protein
LNVESCCAEVKPVEVPKGKLQRKKFNGFIAPNIDITDDARLLPRASVKRGPRERFRAL